MDCDVAHVTTVQMPAELEREYGEWNRASLTNRTLGKTIYESDQGEHFFIGLLSGSKSLVGMLAGLQHLGPDRQPLQDSMGRDILGLPRLGESKPLKVGLVWISARGDFNTPNTSMEGDMGGMNVAVAAGLSNTMLRQQAGLDPPISTKHIVMAGVQNTNPYEQLNIDNSFIETLSVAEMREPLRHDPNGDGTPQQHHRCHLRSRGPEHTHGCRDARSPHLTTGQALQRRAGGFSANGFRFPEGHGHRDRRTAQRRRRDLAEEQRTN